MKKLNLFIASSLVALAFLSPQKTWCMESNSFISEDESSKSLTKSSHLPNRHSKRAFGDEFVISQKVNSGKFHPSVATLTNGNVFAAWYGFNFLISPGGSTSNTLQIYGRVYSPQGTAISDEIPITTTTFNIPYGSLSNVYPSVASLTNGNAFVTYHGKPTPDEKIYGQIFSSNGTRISNELLLNNYQYEISQNRYGGATYPSAAGLTNGNVFVTWTCGAIYGNVFSPQGNAIRGEFSIYQDNYTEVSTGSQSSVASLTNGNVFATWYSSGISKIGIYGRVFFPNGTALGNQFAINQNTTGNQFTPFVASLTNGNAFVTWVTNQNGNKDTRGISNYDIFGRVFFPNGTASSNEFGINQLTTQSWENPSVTSLTDGNVFVTWDGNQDGNRHNIYGRIFSPNGTAISNQFGINQLTTRDQVNPSVASLINGDAFVAWSNGGSVSSSNDISGRIVPGQGFPPAPIGAPSSSPVSAPSSSSSRLAPNSLFLIPAKIVMGGVKAIQSSCNYAKSWFSLKDWSKSLDSVEEAVLVYSLGVVENSPSYFSLNYNLPNSVFRRIEKTDYSFSFSGLNYSQGVAYQSAPLALLQ